MELILGLIAIVWVIYVSRNDSKERLTVNVYDKDGNQFTVDYESLCFRDKMYVKRLQTKGT